MKILLDKLSISVGHLKCLDEIFRENHEEYQRIEKLFGEMPFKEQIINISRELYAGGKTAPQSRPRFDRQMILGDNDFFAQIPEITGIENL